MKLVVAEKPSVARDIAAVIGADESVNGVMRGNGCIVTSARGHLVRLKEPEEYDTKYENCSISDLPIVPDFEFVPIKSAEDDKLFTNKGKKLTESIITTLLSRALSLKELLTVIL